MAEPPVEGAAAAAAAGTQSATAPRSAHGPVLLHDRYQISPDRPVPEFSTPSASAFAVEDRHDIGRQLFGLICTPGLLPRTDAAAVLRGSHTRNLLPLVEYDTIDWPPLGQRTVIMIYERPMGGKFVDALANEGGSISEHDLQHRIIEPLANALQEMANHDVPHCAVRPDNLFLMDSERLSIVIGDCLTTPPGFDQPLVFETIRRSMAGPAGRGEGDISDDLYALGVTLVFLLLGKNPVAGMSEDELLYAKVEQGTYATLCGTGGRIPINLLEPLRGLLSDHADERWGLRELSLWIDGRRMTPIQKRAAVRSEARFPFAGHDHVTTRTLAHAFSRNVPDAARVLKEGQLDTWLRRSLSNAPLAEAIIRAVDIANANAGDPLGSDEMLVSHASMLLDPDAPIRYKGYAFLPDSFGPSLAVELLRNGTNKVGIEILKNNVAGLWFEVRTGMPSSYGRFASQYDTLRAHLDNPNPGYGIERCLYDLNANLACQSPLVVQDYVTEIEDLLPALDEAADRADTKSSPVDRHIAAFIAAHLEEDTDSHLQALGDKSEAKKAEGMLSLLALVQWRVGPDALYGLSSWVGGLLGPAISSYHSRSARRDIEREVPRLVRQGSLPDLFDLIDNKERRSQDQNGYQNAIHEFLIAENEIQQIENSDSARSESAERIGQQAAAMTSVVMTLIFATIVFINGIW